MGLLPPPNRFICLCCSADGLYGTFFILPEVFDLVLELESVGTLDAEETGVNDIGDDTCEIDSLYEGGFPDGFLLKALLDEDDESFMFTKLGKCII